MSDDHARTGVSDAAQDGRYPRVMRAVRETPWAIMPGKLAEILAMLSERAAGGRLSDEEIQARIGGRDSRRDQQVVGYVAIIPVYGVISGRADLMTDISGGTSVQRLQTLFRDAVSDRDISGIVLDVDSPGGSTDLLTEMAAQIRAARGKKPVAAVANTRAASAAYWLASQADELVVTPSGDVGSIGVFAAHDDLSAFQEKMGVKTTLISSGRFKVEGNPFEPLTDEARDAIQAMVDEFYGMFVSDVAKGRRVSVETVRGDFGEGRMLTARAALRAGMVDRIGTLEDTVRRMSRGGGPVVVPSDDSVPEPPPDADAADEPADVTALTPFTDAVDETLRAFESVVNRAEALRALTGAKRQQLTALVERANELLAATAEDPEPTATLNDLGFDAEFELLAARLHL